MFSVESGVVMPPPSKKGRPTKYPFRQMKVGDSFFVPDENGKKMRDVVGASTANWGKAHGAKFSCRSVDGGTRVWRVA